MIELNEHDKHVESLYKKISVSRQQQVQERTRELVEESIMNRMSNLFGRTLEAYDDPKIPRQKLDELKQDLAKTFDLIVMHTDHDVIMALTNEAITKNFKNKIINE